MRSLPVVLFLITIGAGAATAEKKPQTEAGQDGLSGSVHSVVMTEQTIMSKLDPAGGWVVQNIPSGNVEYDRQGYRMKVGKDDANGEFQGQMSQIMRDAHGRVIERTIRILPSQDLLERDVYGPFGLVESTFFSSGKPTSVHTVNYDQLGNVLDESTMDGNGKPMGRTLYRRNSNGAWTERTMWIQGVLHSFETYNPDSDFQRYEQYDSSGDVMTTFTYSHGRVQTYWSALTDPNGGTPMIDNLDNGDTRTTFCHNQGRTCDERTRHAVYLDPVKHNPIMTEILSDDGRPLVRAFYEYQMDGHENWTTRKVWVQPGEQGERALYETDSRTITYWSE
jgi:hypothetical protein